MASHEQDAWDAAIRAGSAEAAYHALLNWTDSGPYDPAEADYRHALRVLCELETGTTEAEMACLVGQAKGDALPFWQAKLDAVRQRRVALAVACSERRAA